MATHIVRANSSSCPRVGFYPHPVNGRIVAAAEHVRVWRQKRFQFFSNVQAVDNAIAVVLGFNRPTPPLSVNDRANNQPLPLSCLVDRLASILTPLTQHAFS
jgi:hypothetical protein